MIIKIEINGRPLKLFNRLFSGWKGVACLTLILLMSGALTKAAIDHLNIFQEGEIISSQDINDNFQYLEQKIVNLPTGTLALPAGTIMPFGGDRDHVPEGWLLCDGREMSRDTYTNLFAAISTNWGAGNGSTTFNLPDLRGQFLRGNDYDRTGETGRTPVDPERDNRTCFYPGGNTGINVGSFQDDSIGDHDHKIQVYSPASGSQTNLVSSTMAGTTYNGDAVLTRSGGLETRSKNAAVNFLIKY